MERDRHIREAEAMDNFKLVLVASRGGNLDRAIELAMNGCAPGGKAQCYAEVNTTENSTPMKPTLILYWLDKIGTRLAYPHGTEEVKAFIKGWLKSIPESAWGLEPDHDGSNSHGFRVEAGRTGASNYEILRITPEWAEHHK